MQKNKFKYLFLTLVLLISVFLHFYRIGNTYVFHNDEARDVLVVKKMIDTGKPVLLGPQTSVGNMYLGPLYYYLITPALMLSKMDPVGPAAMVAFFGVMTTALLYIYGYKKYGLLGAVIASLFYSLSPVMLHYSRSSWNPNLVPFFATLLLFAIDLKNWKGWFVLGLCAGVIFQLHYVALVIVGLAAIYKITQKPTHKEVLMSLLGFLITSSPFWIFEIRHSFVNSQAFFTFLEKGSQNKDLNSTYFSRFISNIDLTIKGVFASSSIALTQMPSYVITILTVFVFVLLPLITKQYLLWYFFVGSAIVVSFLKEKLNVHYVSYLFPIAALSLSSLATKGPKLTRIITLIFLGYFIIWCFPSVRYNIQSINSIQTKRAQETANYIVQEANNQKYNIVATPGTYSTTVEYFLSLSANPPSNSYEKLVFDICEGGPCPDSDTTTVLFYGSGPTHPAISDYLGHPAINEFKTARSIQKNERVSYDIWVATMIVDQE